MVAVILLTCIIDVKYAPTQLHQIPTQTPIQRDVYPMHPLLISPEQSFSVLGGVTSITMVNASASALVTHAGKAHRLLSTNTLERVCIEPAHEIMPVFARCDYGDHALNMHRVCSSAADCSFHGVCFFGRCFCAPDHSGLTCNHRAVLGVCTLPSEKKSYRDRFDGCFRTLDYGSAVIPKARWVIAQSAEARLWARTTTTLTRNAATGDRANMHVVQFDKYRSLPPGSLGKVMELGSGQWTQTHFLLKARPDVRAELITLVDPGIDGYIRSGNAVYRHGRLNGIPVELLSIGAEEVPVSYHGSYDTLVMINCIEHTFNGFATLNTASRMLKRGGLFIFQERSVLLSAHDQIFHPVRLKLDFFKWFLNMTFDGIYSFTGRTREMRRKAFIEGEIYFIGRKK